MKSKTKKLNWINFKKSASPKSREVNPRGWQMSMDGNIWEKEMFCDWNERMMGW